MKYQDLPERAKARIRDQRRNWNVDDDSWWDGVYEDFINVATRLGIDTDPTNVYFSGFCSQGDGASFIGKWSAPKEPPSTTVRQHAPEDTELHRIADALTAFLLRYRLAGRTPEASIGLTSGQYFHAHMMQIDLSVWSNDGHDEPLAEDDERELQQLMRDLADWLYDQLEKEHDHLTDDDTLDEQFADEEFDEEEYADSSI